MFKRFLKSRAAARIASGFVAFYIRLVRRTSSWEMIGREHFEALDHPGQGFILAFWHSRLLMAPTVRGETDKRVFMLISTHRDGEIIANAVAPFGIEFIRGSAANPQKSFKEKSGAPALAQMIAALKEGAVVGVTPDGPRGPSQKAKIGVIKLAQMAGAPILPAAYATSRGRRLNTWDRFWLALPFSKGVFMVGAPLAAPGPDADVGALREALTGALNAVTDEAEAAASGRSLRPRDMG
ncbi:MAG: lysophospholipid acyltransferase family protein [Pseudomonadota bacterium]